MNARAIRLFQQAAYVWLALYAATLLFYGHAAWAASPVELVAGRHGIAGFVNHVFQGYPVWLGMVFLVLMVITGALQVRSHDRALGLLIWFLFRLVTHRTWLASNGGIQLMQTMLLWAALMGPEEHGMKGFLGTFAFWAARLQLLLAYAMAAAHKFTGTAWLDGSAVRMVAGDPLFHLGFLLQWPWLCTALTYAALGWMTLFPLAVWWRPSRRIWLVVGVLFHLSTAVFMGIPQLALAFIACYALWVRPGDFPRLLRDRKADLTRIDPEAQVIQQETTP